MQNPETIHTTTNPTKVLNPEPRRRSAGNPAPSGEGSRSSSPSPSPSPVPQTPLTKPGESESEMRIPLDGGGETTLSSSGTADGSSTTDGLGNAASISQTRTNSTDALALEASKKYQPPMAKAIRQKIFECDGVEVYDEYYWFRDRSNPKVLKYLEDENAYAEAMMEDTSELQDALYEVLGSAAILSLSLYLSLLFFFFNCLYLALYMCSLLPLPPFCSLYFSPVCPSPPAPPRARAASVTCGTGIREAAAGARTQRGASGG